MHEEQLVTVRHITNMKVAHKHVHTGSTAQL